MQGSPISTTYASPREKAVVAAEILKKWIVHDKDLLPVLVILTSVHCPFCTKQRETWKERMKQDCANNDGQLPYKTMVIENSVREFLPNRLRLSANKNVRYMASLIEDVSQGVPKLIRFYNNGEKGRQNFDVHTGYMDSQELCAFTMKHKPQFCGKH